MAARKRCSGTRGSRTQEQVTGFGLEVQAKAIKDYGKANGLRLVRTLSDEGQSGGNGLDARVGLAEALAIIERGEVAGIVVSAWTGWPVTCSCKRPSWRGCTMPVSRCSPSRSPTSTATIRPASSCGRFSAP